MSIVNVLIVEDNAIIGEDIAEKLRRNKIGVAAILATGEEAVDFFSRNAADLLLMDIKLGGILDGISAVQIIRKSSNLPVIYLTDHTDKANVERALTTHPSNYLAKPFNESDLIRAIDIAISNWLSRDAQNIGGILPDYFFVKEDNTYIKLAMDDVVCLEADRSYCKIITRDKVYLQSNSMSHVAAQIPNPNFIKVHRSYIVNATKITAIEGNIIRLGDHKVEMSKGMRDEVIGKLKILR